MICNSEGFTEKWKNTNRDEILKNAKKDLELAQKRILEVTGQKEEVKQAYIESAKEYQLESYV